jgi:hypothetical protein
MPHQLGVVNEQEGAVMGKRIVSPLVLALLSIGIASCQKLESPKPRGGGLPFELAQMRDAVPAQYGSVVSVTTLPTDPYVATLWFAKPDQSIVAVRVNTSTGEILERVLVIPRR